MKKLVWGLVVLAALAVIGGGGYYFLQKQATEAATSSLQDLETSLQKVAKDTQLEYASVRADIIDRSVTVQGLRIVRPSMKAELTIKTVSLKGDANVIRDATLSDIVMKAEGIVAVTIARAKLSEVALMQSALPNDLGKLTGEEIVKFLNSLDVGDITVNGIKVDQPGKVQASYSEIQLAGLKAGVINSLVIKGAEIKVADAEVDDIAFARFEVKSLDLKLIQASIQGGAVKHGFGISELTGNGWVFKSTQMKSKVSIARAGVDGVTWDGDVLTQGHLFIENLEVPLAAIKQSSPEFYGFLQGIKQNAFRISSNLRAKLDMKTGGFSLGPVVLAVQGMGELKVAGAVSDLNVPSLRLLAKGDDNALATLGGKIAQLSVDYTDDKLADQILDSLSNGDRKKLANEWSQMVMGLAGPDKQAGAMAAKAVLAFVTGAKGFKILVQPPKPLTMEAAQAALMGGTAGRDLNLRISGE